MAIAALITWLLTAVGGFIMLGTWIAKGGHRQPRTTHLPPPLIFGHFALAAAGLVIWIIYVIADSDALAWTAFVVLVPVAVLGFTMLARWRGARSATVATAAAPTGGATSAGEPPERSFPVPVIVAHGVFAVVTVVLVLLTAVGIGGS
jgi:hypothetical protein